MVAKRVGVLLSGCGVMDGSEIHEAVLTMLALDRAGAEIVYLAPNKEQSDVINHVGNVPTSDRRNCFEEAARIARGKIRDLKHVSAGDLDALILPGGYGATKNLVTFAKDGPRCTVDPDVARLLRELQGGGKPIGALCIAPMVLAKVFGPDLHPEVTIGTDVETARALESMGARHRNASVNEVVIDRKNKFVTTPCYMLAGSIREVSVGAEKAVQALLEMV